VERLRLEYRDDPIAQGSAKAHEQIARLKKDPAILGAARPAGCAWRSLFRRELVRARLNGRESAATSPRDGAYF
jgi:hypothetical protein